MDNKFGALSIPEFCTRYAVGRSFAYQEIGAGRLKAVKAGSRTLIPVQAAEVWLSSLQKAGGEEASNAAA
jgi:hypothetical protein